MTVFGIRFSIDKNNKGNYLASLIKTQSKDLGNAQMTRCNISKKLAKGNKGIKKDHPHLKELGLWMDGSFFQANQAFTK